MCEPLADVSSIHKSYLDLIGVQFQDNIVNVARLINAYCLTHGDVSKSWIMFQISMNLDEYFLDTFKTGLRYCHICEGHEFGITYTDRIMDVARNGFERERGVYFADNDSAVSLFYPEHKMEVSHQILVKVEKETGVEYHLLLHHKIHTGEHAHVRIFRIGKLISEKREFESLHTIKYRGLIIPSVSLDNDVLFGSLFDVFLYLVNRICHNQNAKVELAHMFNPMPYLVSILVKDAIYREILFLILRAYFYPVEIANYVYEESVRRGFKVSKRDQDGGFAVVDRINIISLFTLQIETPEERAMSGKSLVSMLEVFINEQQCKCQVCRSSINGIVDLALDVELKNRIVDNEFERYKILDAEYDYYKSREGKSVWGTLQSSIVKI